MSPEKQGDTFISKTRVGSHRGCLKMTPIREAAEELADLPFGHMHRHGLRSDDLPLEGLCLLGPKCSADTQKHRPCLSRLSLPPAQRPPETALTRASAPTARVPELINETAAEVLTAGWTLIKKSPGWTLLCSYNK